MRSQSLIRRTLNASANRHCQPSLASSGRPTRPYRKPQATSYSKRLASTTVTTPTNPDAPPSASVGPGSPSDEPEKPKRRVRAPATAKDFDPQLPVGLDILWLPDEGPSGPSQSPALPPPDILEEALTNLHITLQPQTQHRATYASPWGPPIEPTLALYCPIEGGEYIIDATVRELARRTGSEVVVLDAVQLAAGEWGHFGKAANSLRLSRNPLHFPSSSVSHPPLPSRSFAIDQDNESEPMISPSQMTLVMTSMSPTQGRTVLSSPTRRDPTPSNIKIFFDELINVPAKLTDSANSPTSSGKPRIIYIRDFPTLAPSSSTWYPPLLSAVRQRRQGPISRPTSPIASPMTIIFGITPSLTFATSMAPSPSPANDFMSVLTNRNQPPPHSISGSRTGKPGWGEDGVDEKAREKRLRDRLRKWEKGDNSLLNELPQLSSNGGQGGEGISQHPDIVFIGGPGSMSVLPPPLGPGLSSRSSIARRGSPDPAANSRFFRTTILVPNVRSLAQEQSCRVERRREINELTMRMGVGAIGGLVGERDRIVESSTTERKGEDNISELSQQTNEGERMWEDWGSRVEVWADVRQIADRAVGNVIAANASSDKSAKSTLDPTNVPWSAIHRAWAVLKLSGDLRKAWSKTSSVRTAGEQYEDDEGGEHELALSSIDPVVEGIKQDPDLDPHEQTLLSCIVDTASMPTSFSHVHLPPHTIDSVRTIVSLPLLHPTAFQQGILKEHGMTGVLLFGPPGTGKTLVVRALAKEAGCRMLAISPSDVMDMYVGEGEKLVKSVFTLARRLSPCVIFLDEIDALFGARISARDGGGAFAHRGVITEFMQEMDGLKSSANDRVVVIGATNRPFDLDDAVLRRLPRRLLIDLPGEKEREEILKILLRDEVLANGVDLKTLARQTESFSGSDLKHLCVSAALDSVKDRVDVPWTSRSPPAVNPVVDVSAGRTESSSPMQTSFPPLPEKVVSSNKDFRILCDRNFTKALKEVTPSSSESLGTLADLRKWNEEFGEGQKDRKGQQAWGKGRFGFVDKAVKVGEGGRVALNDS